MTETTVTQGLLFGGEESAFRDTDLYPSSRVMLASGGEDWCTPPEVLEVIRRFKPVAFDPFSNPWSLVDAEHTVAKPDNSLTIDWPGHGLIFCNPPYGAALRDCAKKIGAEGRRRREIIALVPARLDTAWWQDDMRPPIFCAWSGRITFLETVASLEARHAERAAKAIAAGLKPPAAPKYQREGEHLARGETATFASVFAYFGPHPGRFAAVFEDYGRIYRDLE